MKAQSASAHGQMAFHTKCIRSVGNCGSICGGFLRLCAGGKKSPLLNPKQKVFILPKDEDSRTMDWGRMRFKTRKSQSLVLKKGKLV